mgnify:CR=1 FL=1|jgi:hypothetical protein|tara:strand:+ start:924 stop:1160 length:237 start_codon:yes stop_codon:yes gene_type:complete
MKKGITRKEYFKRTKKEKEELAKQGIIDFQEKRVKRMWDDPNVADEDIPCVKFTFDSESGDMIFVEEKPYGTKDEEQK